MVGFCRKRQLPADRLRIRQVNEFDPECGVLTWVALTIEAPADFPEEHGDALVRVADQCAVKRDLQAQPAFRVRTVVAAGSEARRAAAP